MEIYEGKVLNEISFHHYSLKYGTCFEANIGAEAIYSIFKNLDLNKLKKHTEEMIENICNKVNKTTKIKYENNIIDFKIPWNFRTDLSLYYTTQYNEETYKFKHTITKTLSFSTDVNLTSKWKVSVQSGYDIENRQLTYTNINIYRDLHCWEMRFSWIPFGSYKSYSFQINVKSAVLQDLKRKRRIMQKL